MPDAASTVTLRAVFLSYAHEDTAAALRIAEALRAAGIEVWLDQSELRGGDAWDATIKRQIHECGLFVPLISGHTQARSEGYFRREWKLGVERTHDMAEDVPFLVPVVIDDTSDAAARVPDKFREVQWTRLPDRETSADFAIRVRRLLGIEREPGARVLRAPSVLRPSVESAPSPPTALAGWRPMVGEQVPGTVWQLEAKLGEGGFGEVWLARHAAMKERRVFKFCFRPDRVRSLKRELTLFRVIKEKVGAHPHIVRLLDVHIDEHPVYVEMDYVAGQNLKQWCDNQGGVSQVPLAVRLEIIAQVAEALQAAHAAGVIHRDVKPGNILVEQPATAGALPVAKLSDFGIGQVTSGEILAGVTQSGFTQSVVADFSPQTGTPVYMAPELLVGEAATAQSDIYSLGVVLYQLLAGDLRRPLSTDWPRRIEDACLREDLERCFAGNTAERFLEAGQFAASLRAWPRRREERIRQEAATAARQSRRRRRRRILLTVGAAGMAILAACLLMLQWRQGRQRWAREVALPEIRRLAEVRDNRAALVLARQVQRLLPEDPVLRAVWAEIAAPIKVASLPPGAEVEVRDYHQPTAAWEPLGLTPLDGTVLPRGFYRWRFRKDGYLPLETAWRTDEPMEVNLDKPDALPTDMVRVSASGLNGWVFENHTGLPPLKMADYAIDRHEVTNREFAAFVNQGGYANRSYWKQPFLHDGKALNWEQAQELFVDSTGKPGPATWKRGTYAKASADLPVTGVSWYEAAAYAEFAGKRLPSIYHWRWAAMIPHTETLLAESNFNGQRLWAAASSQSMSRWGAYDMAGNAKEWCWNEADPGVRLILGGGWSEPSYMYQQLDALPAFDRTSLNGFRCMRVLTTEPTDPMVDAPRAAAIRDISKESPVSDEIYRSYLSLFEYDRTPLEVREEAVDDSDPRWRKLTVSFTAAYNNERMAAVLFLPKSVPPPYQTVLFFPGADALSHSTIKELTSLHIITVLVEGGRAVIYPVYKGTFERGPPHWIHPAVNPTVAFRDWEVMLLKDVRRSLDYLETRTDIRSGAFAFCGNSWGAREGAWMPAVETRLKASILIVGGISRRRLLPEVEPLNHAPRIKIPTLMLNGRTDFVFPLETSQKPLFALLGTPPEHKRHMVYESGHIVSVENLAKEIPAWLDRYLGPVKQAGAPPVAAPLSATR